MSGVRTVLIDNLDPFAGSLVRLLAAAGADVVVKRGDAVTLPELARLQPRLVVISSGPGTPATATVSVGAVRQFAGVVQVLGLGLGMLCIAEALGGRTAALKVPLWGKARQVSHDGTGLLRGLPSPLAVGCYHAIGVRELPGALLANASSADGEIMALRHPAWPLAGVQFHPGSFLTEHGDEVLRHAVDGRF